MTEDVLVILRACLNGERLSEDQVAVLDQWSKSSRHNAEALQLLDDKDFVKGAILQMEAYTAGQDLNWIRLRQVTSTIPVRRMFFLRKWGWTAAAGLILLVTGVYLMRQKPQQHLRQLAIARPTFDVLPGRSGAILTLSDGRQIVLDSVGNGMVALQGSTEVRLKDGRVFYHAGTAAADVMTYNTMTTPRGRQYQMVLPDGTKVWLNAASRLTFPTTFTGTERKVEVAGEAYFEVAKDVKRPFRVKVSNGIEIEVLGTSFNVNAYTDEASINTTLVEGAVNVVSSNTSKSNGKEQVVMNPGEQSQVYASGIRIVKDADVEQALAWKNGSFAFKEADLPTVMRQLARWYNVEVSFAGAIPDKEFTGEIGRSLTLDQVLRILTQNKVAYKIEDARRITILP